jgi:hypothetical protein
MTAATIILGIAVLKAFLGLAAALHRDPAPRTSEGEDESDTLTFRSEYERHDDYQTGNVGTEDYGGALGSRQSVADDLHDHHHNLTEHFESGSSFSNDDSLASPCGEHQFGAD